MDNKNIFFVIYAIIIIIVTLTWSLVLAFMLYKDKGIFKNYKKINQNMFNVQGHITELTPSEVEQRNNLLPT